MSDYITNSKNRKLKTKILLFLSRINIGASNLPISGRFILFMELILAASLFFPWIQFRSFDAQITHYSAFSAESLYIGYGALFIIGIIPFFLLSHTKKEILRAWVPFRLSDAQAIVFLTTILLTTLITLITVQSVYDIRFTEASLQLGYKIALSAVLCTMIAAFFLSQYTKASNTEICYLDHQ